MKDEKVKVRRPLVRKLLIWIGLPLLLVYIIVILFTYYWSGKNALEQMKEYLFELTSHHACMLHGKFLKVSGASVGVADAIDELSIPTKNELYSLMKKKLSENSDIYGMATAFNPYAYNKKNEFFSPYVYRSDKNIKDIDLAKSYDYTLQDWFMIPKLLGTSYWGEPYFDEGGGNIFMATYSQPMYKIGKFVGVSTADISLEDLEREMNNIRIMAGYTFIITRTGTFIYHPIKEYIMNESIFSLAEEDEQSELREIGKKMIAGEQGITTFRDVNTGEKSWLVYSPIPDCHWSFAAVIPYKEIMKTVNSMVIRQITIMVIGLLIILLVILWAAIGITNPIKRLLGFANKISKGDLDEKITGIRGHDEIHELVKAFNKMTYDLKHYIADLTAATKAKESVESELRIARQIQESLLPRIFPPFPDVEEF
ncbi:MAG: cache domain-containing protein, partial [Candidatus Celaenobacter polaris]|nr:cache domain-containing protein [Candidatus Celaenobacter polaris]